MSVSFHNQDIIFALKDKRVLKQWLSAVISKENSRVGDIAFIFCSDEYLLTVNKQYLKHDYFTDVITFDYSENSVISGDIFISIDRIKENAETFNSTFHIELLRIMVHGVLHLIGYGDKSEDAKIEMTSKEDEYLRVIQTQYQN